ncbi:MULTISPECIES: FAD/NAD(P)-binding protein [Actinomadura]|uniref:Oxidoreductase n=1 Tax=Actinomadura litoris TaxID=2678616 RepID=A0A7K1L5V9_9ACTN|nr:MULTISPECIES: FAD/NAD(P)-binding protein [Actinomadura]MBT2212670.1 FAD/NAD(P)-binding protein [Actinomadura sp. NEAU-AAG7]MUN39646.1 oxidoreductase [Actinomadura litoris]
MAPVPYRVVAKRAETAETVTLTLAPVGAAIPEPEPGQFTMMYAFGIGEVPISVSRTRPVLEQTIRAVGAVTGALCRAEAGQVIGLRGPFGTGWGVDEARGRDLVLAAGGIGLAPLRPAILRALARRDDYGRVAVLIGARTPGDLLFEDELETWRARGAQVEVTVDRPAPGWTGHVGLITALAGSADVDPSRAAAYVCGPEIMMRLTAQALAGLGTHPGRIRVSLERSMRCGIGWCGHCQLGPLLICRDGPVVPYESAVPLMAVKEL